MATQKSTSRRASPARTTTRKRTTPRAKTKKAVSRKTTSVARVHHHWKKSHYQNVLHFSIAPKYSPIRGFSFLEGTLAIMLAVFSFTILLGNTSVETEQAIMYNAQTVTVHHEHHSDLYNFFRTNKTVDVFTQG